MRTGKQWTSLILVVGLCVSLLGGCAETEEPEQLSLSVSVGGVLDTLDPIYAEGIADQTILAHLYENLMRVSVDADGQMSVVGGMAKSVEQEKNYDGTVTYTFRLRSAKWSDGKSVKASDFVYAWQRLASPGSNSPYAELLSVICGYDEARHSGDMSLLQVTAKNESTLVVVLDGNYDWFLSQVCTSPATMPLRQDVVRTLKEAGVQAAEGKDDVPVALWWEDPTLLVTNGPYSVTEYKKGVSLQTASSEHYYGDVSGPENLAFRFAATAENAWKLYEENAVDAVWPLTEERLSELAADENWTAIPELGTYTVLFNTDTELFGDALIRQAMNFAVDRNVLAQVAGVTARPAEGLVAYGVPENEEGDFRTVGGPLLDNDPELYREYCTQAQDLLSQAGYDSGAALGALEYLYVDEGNNRLVAEELCRQWMLALHITVNPRAVTERELWAALRSGNYTLAGVELVPDGNDAECFLSEWVSGSQNNVVRYENSAYDTLMAIIASAADGTARMGCLHDAEALLMADHVLAPLFTKGTDWEMREDLYGVFRDPRGWFGFYGAYEKTA